MISNSCIKNFKNQFKIYHRLMNILLKFVRVD
ncbi:hypothetical protein BLA29_013205 [Euroglyphus maynei]|uniref:Uncharacterized protein n=1 Tax=Euroglyphus maynei TaxID=6958 RepID=A0A1Y3BUU0_EURMA|nr:hypothetical protein BLA29_013205 [Euroglyphus maynei]